MIYSLSATISRQFQIKKNKAKIKQTTKDIDMISDNVTYNLNSLKQETENKENEISRINLNDISNDFIINDIIFSSTINGIDIISSTINGIDNELSSINNEMNSSINISDVNISDVDLSDSDYVNDTTQFNSTPNQETKLNVSNINLLYVSDYDDDKQFDEDVELMFNISM
jgi:hypothetical protein